MLEGLPELKHLNIYGNKVAEVIISDNPRLLSKLETLDLGFNNLERLPDNLNQLKALQTLKVGSNCLEKVPMQVCDMDLKTIDVSCNPVTEPPVETCDRGIGYMRLYWRSIKIEEQSKQRKSVAEAQKKLRRQARKRDGHTALDSPSTRRIVSTGSVSVPTSSVSACPSSLSGLSVDSLSDPYVKPANSTPMKHSVLEPPPLSAPPAAGLNAVDSGVVGTICEEVATDSVNSLEDVSFDRVTVNDTLKVIFLGMAMVGKTSMIKRLIEGRDAVVPTNDQRTIGVDIYNWDPKKDARFEHIDSRIEFQDTELAKACGDVNVKFSVWDFAGQHVYHATHQLFFSSRALYVLVWDMGATNTKTVSRKTSKPHDSSGDESDNSNYGSDLEAELEEKRADRALEHDIDDKVQVTKKVILIIVVYSKSTL